MEVVKLGKVMKQVKRAEAVDPDKKYPLLGVRLYGEGPFHRETKRGADSSATKLYQVQAGDFIYSRLFAWRGAFGIVPPELDGHYVSNEFPTFRPKDGRIDPRYLYYWFLLPSTLERVEEDCIGTTKASRNRFKEPFFKALTLDLPSLEEQRERVEHIERAVSLTNRVRERLDRSAADLSVLRQRILQDAVEGRLTRREHDDEPAGVLLERIAAEKQRLYEAKEIRKPKTLPPVAEDEQPFDLPEGWAWARLGDLGEWGAGATPSRKQSTYYTNGTIPWIKTGELNDGLINSAEEHVTDLAYAECSLRLNPPGSVLVAMYGATIGKLGLLEIEATTNQACCACRPLGGIPAWYLFYFLLSKRQDFRDLGAGGAQPNISKAKLTIEPIPLPPPAEQRRIVERVDRLMALCDRLEAQLAAAQHDAGRLMRAVLEEALAAPSSPTVAT